MLCLPLLLVVNFDKDLPLWAVGTSVIRTSFNLLLRLWEEAAWWNVPACGSPIGRTNNVLAAALQPPTPTQPLGGMIGHGKPWRNISGCILNCQSGPCKVPTTGSGYLCFKGTTAPYPPHLGLKNRWQLIPSSWWYYHGWKSSHGNFNGFLFFLNEVTLWLEFYKNLFFRCRFWIPDKAFQA